MAKKTHFRLFNFALDEIVEEKTLSFNYLNALLAVNSMAHAYLPAEAQLRQDIESKIIRSVEDIIDSLESEFNGIKATKKFIRLVKSIDRSKIIERAIAERLIKAIPTINENEPFRVNDLTLLLTFFSKM